MIQLSTPIVRSSYSARELSDHDTLTAEEHKLKDMEKHGGFALLPTALKQRANHLFAIVCLDTTVYLEVIADLRGLRTFECGVAARWDPDSEFYSSLSRVNLRWMMEMAETYYRRLSWAMREHENIVRLFPKSRIGLQWRRVVVMAVEMSMQREVRAVKRVIRRRERAYRTPRC